MVSATNKTVFAGLVKIVVEVLVDTRRTLCRLHNDEFKRKAVDGCVAQLVPINFTLIVRYVYAVNGKAVWIVCIAIQSTPTKTRGTYKEIIKHPYIKAHHAHTA